MTTAMTPKKSEIHNFIKGNSKAGITTGFFVFVQDGKKRHISKINIKIYYGILHF
jgi:hypothetical protein